MVRPGGRLVYSTCTFAPEEDEEAVALFLETHPEFVAESVDCPWFEAGENGSFRMWPHKLRGEGHFAAILRRTEGVTAEITEIQAEKLPKAWLEFAKEMDIHLPDGKMVTFGQSLFWVPKQMPDLRRLKVLRPGLELGVLKKDRFEPAHALALWLRTAAKTHSLPADSQQLMAYMHGETLPATVRGWCLVQADGYSLGWGKGDGNCLKNHYPKGLRR